MRWLLLVFLATGFATGAFGSEVTATTPEFRLSIKADYDMIANRTFCTYGVVKKGATE